MIVKPCSEFVSLYTVCLPAQLWYFCSSERIKEVISGYIVAARPEPLSICSNNVSAHFDLVNRLNITTHNIHKS